MSLYENYRVPLVYIAGRYRSSHNHSTKTQDNMEAARYTGKLALERGWYPVIPHLNTSQQDSRQSPEFFLSATLTLLARCDAVLLVQGWQDSEGSLGEVKLATQKGMLIYQTAEAMPYMTPHESAQVSLL